MPRAQARRPTSQDTAEIRPHHSIRFGACRRGLVAALGQAGATVALVRTLGTGHGKSTGESAHADVRTAVWIRHPPRVVIIGASALWLEGHAVKEQGNRRPASCPPPGPSGQ